MEHFKFGLVFFFGPYNLPRSVQKEILFDALGPISTSLSHFRDKKFRVRDVRRTRGQVCVATQSLFLPSTSVFLALNPQSHPKLFAVCIPQERPDQAEDGK